MSHKETPYTPNFPSKQGYAPPPETEEPKGYPMQTHSGYPEPHSQGMPMPMHAMPPGPPAGFAAGYPHPQHGYPQPPPGYAPGQTGYPPPVIGQPGYPTPVVQQPGPQGLPVVPGGWMGIPQGLTNCPRGLEYLSMVDQLLVHQKVEMMEVITGFETNNKYTVMNSLGQKVYYAVEDNDCCTRACCGPLRPFDIKILDNFQHEVIHLNRPLACDSCCCPCCLQSMEVSAPPGTVIGSIEQQWSICMPHYAVKNASGDTVLQIKGPFCTFSMCGDVEFNVFSKDGETKVGKITKKWSGFANEAFTDADMFGISFPMDLDVRTKATLLGACFLIDYMFFESRE